MNNLFDYYQNENILGAINYEMKYIKSCFDREDCQQEIWAELYDFMPLDEAEAIRIVRRTSRKFRRQNAKDYVMTAPYKDGMEYIDLGDGNYQRKAHRSPAD